MKKNRPLFMCFWITLFLLLPKISIADDMAYVSTSFAESEIVPLPLGAISSGSFESTHQEDGVYEQLIENNYGGSWSIFHVSKLRHTWKFNVASGDNVTFHMKAHCDLKEEGFLFFYSTDSTNGINGTWPHWGTINKNSDQIISFDTFPSDISGTVYIRVQDYLRTIGGNKRDSVFIDYMFFESACNDGFANNPIPTDQEKSVDDSIVLSWNGTCTNSYDVYFGTDRTAVESADSDNTELFKGNQTETTFDPTPGEDQNLNKNTTYYWRIDEVFDDATEKGVVWSFTVYKSAYDPDPEDTATYVYRSPTLSWTAGEGADRHHIYMSKNYDDLVGSIYDECNNSNAPDYCKGEQEETTYNPGYLETGHWYYWRVDEIDTSADYVREGQIWSFYVPAGLIIPAEENLNPNIGGGKDYGDIKDKSQCGEGCVVIDLTEDPNSNLLQDNTVNKFMIVNDQETLVDALDHAVIGDIVYVCDFDADGNEIDITVPIVGVGITGITIPEGVTLASGRGKEKEISGEYLDGATIVAKEVHNGTHLILVNQPNVRITGLKIEGPDKPWPDYRNTANELKPANQKNGVTDNSEEELILEWPAASDFDTQKDGYCIYFSDNFEHVNSAEYEACTGDTPPEYCKGVQIETEYNPSPTGSAIYLEEDKTYYWRVDEVFNHYDSEPVNVVKGPVWSFTVFVRGDVGGRGIYLKEATGVKINNCEIYYWGTGVFVNNEDFTTIEGFPQIRHNFIHDSQLGYSYPVNVRVGFPDISANVFNNFVHAIAGTGTANLLTQKFSNYKARYNIVLEGTGAAQSFDMHGTADSCGSDRWVCSCAATAIGLWGSIAGGSVIIEYNTFAWITPIPNPDAETIKIRGEPRHPSTINNNWFFYDTIDRSVRQTNYYNGSYLDVSNNIIGVECNEDDYYDWSDCVGQEIIPPTEPETQLWENHPIGCVDFYVD